MRGFIIACLVAVAVAAPQGYNYNPSAGGPSSSSFTSNSFGGGLSNGGSSAGFFQGGVQQSQNSFFNQGSSVHQQQHQQAVVSKRFYIHSAPEDNEEDFKERHITVGVPRKNYNVVFIKSPHRSNHKASIKISPAVNEDKTVIYVLSKKTDSSDIHAEVIENAAPTTKPEVFFIKYKTNEEAQHAQQQIQAQYDALGGSSQVSDEGVAPVTSVIGSLGGGAGDAGHAAGQSVAGHAGTVVGGVGSFNTGVVSSHSGSGSPVSHAANNAYLPPNF